MIHMIQDDPLTLAACLLQLVHVFDLHHSQGKGHMQPPGPRTLGDPTQQWLTALLGVNKIPTELHTILGSQVESL